MAHILLSIKNMTGRYYRPIWEECDRKATFALCNHIRKHTKVPHVDGKSELIWRHGMVSSVGIEPDHTFQAIVTLSLEHTSNFKSIFRF